MDDSSREYDLLMRFFLVLSLLLVACTARIHIPPPSPETNPQKSAPARSLIPARGILDPLRVTKKPFGILIDPKTSPVQPERFRGYHTGTDFEIFPDEEDTAVEIFSICRGKVRFTGWVKGYGGVLIQDCTYENEQVTVLYGHLQIDSVSLRPGAVLSKGTKIGNLGKGFSIETDGERKHLHLAIHRGTKLEYRGYVQKEEDLSQWIDPFQDI